MIGKRIDGVIVAALLVSAVWLGSTYARGLRSGPFRTDGVGFNQVMFSAGLMEACGRGMTMPALEGNAWPAPLADFLFQRRDRITCEELPAAGVELQGLQRASRYLLLAVATAFSVGGLAWSSIDGLIGLLFAASIGLAYAASRTTMNRGAAACVAGLLLISPLHLQNLVDVRDYSKAPFFFATLAFIGVLATRTLSPRAVVAMAAAAGAVLGIGCGVRSDVVVYLVVFVAITVLFLPGRFRDTLPLRAAAAAACLLTFGLFVVPISGSYETNSSAWHVSLLGFAKPWDLALGMASAPYELGYFYSDSYVASLVDAFWGRTTGTETGVSVGLPNYAEASRRYYLLLVATFPADVIVRAWGSVVRILELPFSGSATIVADMVPAWLAAAVTALQRLLSLLEVAALPLFVAVLIGVRVYSLRLAFLVFVLAVGFGGYPSIQFQPRHYFHLEIISFWSLLMLGAWSARMIRSRANWRERLLTASQFRSVLVFAAAIVMVVLLPVAIARAYQQRTAGRVVSDYLSAELESAATADRVHDGVAYIDMKPRQQTARRSMHSDMIAADFAGRCGVGTVHVTFRYSTLDPEFDLSRHFEIQVPSPGHSSRLFVPVLAPGAAGPGPARFAFSGVELPAAERGCLSGLSWFREPDRYPLLLPLLVPDSWPDVPMHQRLRDWEPAAFSLDGRAADRPAAATAPRVTALAGARQTPAAPLEYNASIAHVDTLGDFRALVSGARAGTYQLVLANFPRAGALRNPFPISRATVIANDVSTGNMK